MTSTPHEDLANLQWVSVALDESAAVAVRCTADDDPGDQLLWESGEPQPMHTLRLGGLVAERDYRCVAAATCPAGEPLRFELTTGALPPRIPATEIVDVDDARPPTPTLPHLVVNHTRHCEQDVTHRLLVYDLAGDLRWYHNRLPIGTPIAINAHYAGGGRFVWGGGWTPQGATELVDLDQQRLAKAKFSGSEGLVFHHEGRRLADGTLLTLTQSRNLAPGSPPWEGFTVRIVDPATDTVTWEWDSQEAVDAGLLPVRGAGDLDDLYHANAAEMFETDEGEVLVVSLCFLPMVLAVDRSTRAVRWRLGAGGDLTLRDLDGNLLPDTEFPDCQHGVELVDGSMLFAYDNGRYHRDHSRISVYEIDEAAMEATLSWTWTEPSWHEASVGDVDVLSDQRVLVTQAHPDCWSNVPGDRSASVEVDRATGGVVWRHQFLDPQDATYRSDRFDGCDAFPQRRWCPGVAERMAALADVLPAP